MLYFLGICIFIAIYLYFFRETFISELAISFLPYIIVCCMIAVLILTILIFYYKHKKEKNKSIHIFFSIILLIITLGIGYQYYSEFSNFYNQNDNSIRLIENNGIKFFYANILYTNADFQSLQKTIEAEDPDVVILVEFSDAHEKEMKEFFQENYPYVNRNSRSITLAGNVIFSKYPLIDKSEDINTDIGARRYGYVQIDCKDLSEYCSNGIDLYVVHTAAPVSYENFIMRNAQLKKLSDDFILHQQERKNETPIMIIGDFNLSPRSYYYSKLNESLKLKNVLSYQNPTYTRSLREQGIFRSHIDQLFISDSIKISEVDINNLSGSDHRSFLFSIELSEQ